MTNTGRPDPSSTCSTSCRPSRRGGSSGSFCPRITKSALCECLATGSVSFRASQYNRDIVGGILSGGLKNPKHSGGSAELTKTATIGGDILAVEGANTEEVAKLIVAATKSAGRHEASKAAHTSYPSLDPAMV